MSPGRPSLSIIAIQHAVPVNIPLGLSKQARSSGTFASSTPKISRAALLSFIPPLRRASIACKSRSVAMGHSGSPFSRASARCSSPSRSRWLASKEALFAAVVDTTLSHAWTWATSDAVSSEKTLTASDMPQT